MEEKMDPELKAKWVGALRSGKYEQAAGQLYTGAGYCCLGVLNEVAELGFDASDALLDDGGSSAVHGLSLQTQENLAFLNDGGWSFGQIADLVERTL